MIRRPPRSTRTDTLFPYPTLFRSPVRMYSSGMQARLAFSVAVHAEADILLIDEILGVGDYALRRKCLEHLDRLRTENNTSIILVSHNPYISEERRVGKVCFCKCKSR